MQTYSVWSAEKSTQPSEGSQLGQSFLTQSIRKLEATVKFYELTGEVLNEKVRGAITKPCVGELGFF